MERGIERVWVRRSLAIAAIGLVLGHARVGSDEGRRVPDLGLVGVAVLVAAFAVLASPLTGPWTAEVGVHVILLGSLVVAVGAAIPTLLGR